MLEAYLLWPKWSSKHFKNQNYQQGRDQGQQRKRSLETQEKEFQPREHLETARVSVKGMVWGGERATGGVTKGTGKSINQPLRSYIKIRYV